MGRHYVNVFKFMREALSDYAQGNKGDDFPVKDMQNLIDSIGGCIDEIDAFLTGLGFSLDSIIAMSDTIEQLEQCRKAYDRILEKDETKNRFKVLANTLMALYEASKPEIFEMGWRSEKFAAIRYLHGIFCNLIDDAKIRKARERMSQVMDASVTAAENAAGKRGYVIHAGKVIDLSPTFHVRLGGELFSRRNAA